MSDFKKELDELYKFWQEDECPPESKLQFLGDVIFDFTTYDSEMSEYFAGEMIEVLECILDKETYEYISISYHKINYLTMVNMPFLSDKLSWGGSIRGAWFQCDSDVRLDCGRLRINGNEFAEFIKQLLQWVNE